jgi:hypothetical protein
MDPGAEVKEKPDRARHSSALPVPRRSNPDWAPLRSGHLVLPGLAGFSAGASASSSAGSSTPSANRSTGTPSASATAGLACYRVIRLFGKLLRSPR